MEEVIGGILVIIVVNDFIRRAPSAPGTDQDAEMEIVKVSDPSLLSPSDVSTVALDFKVLHPVVITRLGVFPSGVWSELHGNVTVKLFQLDQEVTAVLPLLLFATSPVDFFTLLSC